MIAIAKLWLRVALKVMLLVSMFVGAALLIGRGLSADIIAYVSQREGFGDVMLMDMVREQHYNLTQELSTDAMPLWSPDGERIAFTSTRDGSYAIYIMNFNGDNLRRLQTDTEGVTTPLYWSQDGERLGFTVILGAAVVYETDGNSAPRQMMWTTEPMTQLEWSRDGQQIAFLRNISERGYHLYIIRRDDLDAEPRRLTQGDSNIVTLRWSPDASQLAMISDSGGNGNYEIYVIDVVSADIRRITDNTDYEVALDWSPDGERIIYSAQNSLGLYDMYVIDADGGNVRYVTEGQSPSWRPR